MYRRMEIESSPYKTIVKADGVTVKGIRRLKITQQVGEEIPTVEMECISQELNLDIERAAVRFTFLNNWVTVDKLLPDEDESVLALVEDKYGIHQEVLYRKHFEESDAVYAGTYWCSYRTMNIEAMGICKVLAWQELPSGKIRRSSKVCG